MPPAQQNAAASPAAAPVADTQLTTPTPRAGRPVVSRSTDNELAAPPADTSPLNAVIEGAARTYRPDSVHTDTQGRHWRVKATGRFRIKGNGDLRLDFDVEPVELQEARDDKAARAALIKGIRNAGGRVPEGTASIDDLVAALQSALSGEADKPELAAPDDPAGDAPAN